MNDLSKQAAHESPNSVTPVTVAERLRGLSGLFASIALAGALAACGGGGGGSDPVAPPPAPAPTPAPEILPLPEVPITGPVSGAEGPLVTSAPAPVYASAAAARAFEIYQEERNRCGFGLVSQNAQLDQAAADAGNYWRLRAAEPNGFTTSSQYSHFQDPAMSGFTGVGPIDRMAFRGYTLPQGAGETVVTLWAGGVEPVRGDFTLADLGAHLMSANLTSVYHLAAMFDGWTEFGVDVIRTTTPQPGFETSVGYRSTFLTAVPSDDIFQGQPGLRTMPCQGTVHLYGQFVPASESPNPLPNLSSDTVIGTPIFLNTARDSVLSVATFTVTRVGSTTPETVQLFTGEANGVAANNAFLLPMAALEAGVGYEVVVIGTIDGVSFSRTFTFTPAAFPIF